MLLKPTDFVPQSTSTAIVHSIQLITKFNAEPTVSFYPQEKNI